MNFKLCAKKRALLLLFFHAFGAIGDNTLGTQLLKIVLTNANLHFYIHVLHAKVTARHIPTIFFPKDSGISMVFMT